MSRRWKMQLSVGLAWGVIMTLFNVGFKAAEKGFWVQFTDRGTYIAMFLHFLAGTFIMGYLQWKSAKKANS